MSFQVKPKGNFVFIDDDPDEHEFFRAAVANLGLSNHIETFTNGQDALKYLRNSEDEIFLILSDLNMPKMDGLELKRLLDIIPEIKMKAIPFFFHSNTSSPAEVRAAYASNIQGFLKKADSVEGTEQSVRLIISLWTNCVHPKDMERSSL